MKTVFKISFIVGLFALFLIFMSSGSILLAQEEVSKFSGLKTYAWDSSSPNVIGQTRGDDVSVDSRVKQTTEEELAKKGYYKVKENPDFLIEYSFNVKDNTRVVNIAADDRYGYQDSVQEFDKAKLTLEFVNPKTKSVIWKGQTKAEAYRHAIIVRKLSVVDKAVRKLLSEVPSRG